MFVKSDDSKGSRKVQICRNRGDNRYRYLGC